MRYKGLVTYRVETAYKHIDKLLYKVKYEYTSVYEKDEMVMLLVEANLQLGYALEALSKERKGDSR